MPGLRRYAVPAAALLIAPLVTLAACSDGDGTAKAPDRSASTAPATSSTATSHPASPSSRGSSTAAVAPTGGTADRPTVLTARTRLLDWRQVPGSVDDTVTRSGDWTLTVDKSETEARIEGPGSGSGISAGPRQRISDALIDGQYAVVVLQDRQETRPSSAQVVDLQHGGKTFTIDGSSDVPTTNGGTWALGRGELLHATIHRGSYCIASVDLATRKSSLGWCAPPRHGFNSAEITPAGESLLTFDDSRPACRTVVRLSLTEVTPFEGVPDCKAWDGVVTGDGAVWSVIPREREVEAAHAYARSGDAYFDLGPSASGTLTWCGDAAYFSRDPQRDNEPAQLMRWNAEDGLEVVYESAGGHAFLTPPRCGGDTITVTALAQSGDEQVSARIG
jgi:hypothetical protein